MDDAQLVVAAIAGDRGAFGAIYDRYADPIYDFCASLLRNRAEASDALQETFLVASESLGGLSEPARLRPWLFALAHRSILDRIARDAGAVGGDDAGDLVWGSGPSEARLSRAELAEYVWQVAGGLDVRDRAMLDLHLRQGLEGPDLASATGVAPAQIDERLRRLEAHVDRSLGALVVARTGRRTCPELFAVLNAWDGRLTPEFRDEVNAHVNDCEVCNSRRRIAPSPLTLLAATPLAPAPAYLRSVVLGKAELEAQEREGGPTPGRLSASAGWVFNREGFPDLARDEPGRPLPQPRPRPLVTGPTTVLPAGGASAWAFSEPAAARATAPTTFLPTVTPPERPGSNDRRGALIGGLAGVIVLIAGILFLLVSRSPKKSPVSVGVTTTVSPTSVPADSTTVTTIELALPTTSIATSTTTSTIATTGHLVVGGSGTLSLGVTATTASFMVGNDGSAPLTFAATATGAGLSVAPISGSVPSGNGEPLMVTLDRTMSAPGPFHGTIQIATPGGNSTITVTATIDPGPAIGQPAALPATLSGTMCGGLSTTTGSHTSSVTVTVTSTEMPTEVFLHLQDAGVTLNPIPMTGSASVYTATLGPFSAKGPVTWWITAIDSAGVTAMSPNQTLDVVC